MFDLHLVPGDTTQRRLHIPRWGEVECSSGAQDVLDHSLGSPCGKWRKGTATCTIPSWMLSVLCPDHPVVYACTDRIPAMEERSQEVVQNRVEAELVRQIIEVLLWMGVSESSIGVISPYRSQLRLIHELVCSRLV